MFLKSGGRGGGIVQLTKTITMIYYFNNLIYLFLQQNILAI